MSEAKVEFESAHVRAAKLLDSFTKEFNGIFHDLATRQSDLELEKKLDDIFCELTGAEAEERSDEHDLVEIVKQLQWNYHSSIDRAVELERQLQIFKNSHDVFVDSAITFSAMIGILYQIFGNNWLPPEVKTVIETGEELRAKLRKLAAECTKS